MDFTPFEKMTLGEILEYNVQLQPDKQAYVFGELSYTYRELNEVANALSAGLYALGVRKGDRIAVSLPNCPEFIFSYFAIAKLGAVVVPLNTMLTDREVSYILNNAEVSLAIVSGEFNGTNLMDLYARVKSEVPSLKTIVIVGQDPSAEMLSFQKLLISGAATPMPEVIVEQDDIFSVIYTSGTTGTPKGAMLSHSGIVNSAVKVNKHLDCTEQDRFFVPVPIFHIMGISSGIFCTMLCRATTVIMEIYKPEEALKIIEKERITVKFGVPTMFIMELKHPNFKKYDMTSLRTGIVGGAPCPMEIVKKIRTEMHCNICVSYGMTETSACLTITRFDAPDILRAETVGQPVDGIKIKIVDNERRTLPLGEPGEIACQTPTIMKGYLGKPEATAESIDSEGWFYTGDLGTLDEQGYVRIVGRKKEMIIRGGFKIYPQEVEEVLYTHPAVQMAAVVGLPNPVLGEINCACIKLNEGFEVTAEEIIGFCKDKMIYYKLPDQVVFTENIPTTSSGKIKKMALREALISEGAALERFRSSAMQKN